MMLVDDCHEATEPVLALVFSTILSFTMPISLRSSEEPYPLIGMRLRIDPQTDIREEILLSYLSYCSSTDELGPPRDEGGGAKGSGFQSIVTVDGSTVTPTRESRSIAITRVWLRRSVGRRPRVARLSPPGHRDPRARPLPLRTGPER
jgi:hypothetical protein